MIMKQVQKKLYYRGIILWIITFLVIWGFLAVVYSPYSPPLSLEIVGLLAFIFSTMMVIGIIGSLVIIMPIITLESDSRRRQLYKEHHVSAKLIALYILTFASSFLSGWVAIPVYYFTFWEVLAGGAIVGLITSLIAIGGIRFLLKAYYNKDKKDSARFSFRDDS